MKHKGQRGDAYGQLKGKIRFRFVIVALAAFVGVFAFYRYLWFRRGGDLIVAVFQRLFRMDYLRAYNLYQQIFRNNAEIFFLTAVIVTYLLLLRFMLNWLTGYFDMVNRGIATVLDTDTPIHLPSEMAATERRLYELKAQLKQRTMEARLAEERKNELVMYLAHDMRTPLTSVIGYLSLLAEAPDMPAEKKAKYINITLDKAYRLENMMNEFFDITRYNL